MRFHEKRFAEEYDMRLSMEGYPGSLLEIVERELNIFNTTVIDVGAGSGFFSIPLAQKGYHITAIEPSSEMIRIFKNKLDTETVQKIDIIHTDWESWSGHDADFLISIHSVYPMNDLREALLKMKKYSKKAILFVKAEQESATLSDIIRGHFNVNKCSFGYTEEIEKILTEEKIIFTRKDVVQERGAFFIDLDKEAEYYSYRLNLEESFLPVIKDIIKKNVVMNDEIYTYKSIYFDHVYVF